MTLKQVFIKLKKLKEITMNNYLQNPKLPFKIQTKKFYLSVIIIFTLSSILPWVSFTSGNGIVTSIDPNERVQIVTAPVGGFIQSWKVNEGDYVKAGTVIAQLVDNDPALMERITKERDAAQAATQSAKLMMDTSLFNMERQKSLFNQGLSPKKEYEKAKIEYSKLVVEYQKSLANLAKTETQLSRQSQLAVIAPRNGHVVRVLAGEKGQLIKAGTPVVVFTPEVSKKAVEVWVDGNDAPLIQKGMDVRLQFEGWPSIQIPGWPSVAINTFGGKVFLVDQASSYQGKFRVLIIEDEVWPSNKFLRLGANARAFINLRETNLIGEMWRQLNRFPPILDPIKDELKIMLEKTKDLEKESDEKEAK